MAQSCKFSGYSWFSSSLYIFCWLLLEIELDWADLYSDLIQFHATSSHIVCTHNSHVFIHSHRVLLKQWCPPSALPWPSAGTWWGLSQPLHPVPQKKPTWRRPYWSHHDTKPRRVSGSLMSGGSLDETLVNKILVYVTSVKEKGHSWDFTGHLRMSTFEELLFSWHFYLQGITVRLGVQMSIRCRRYLWLKGPRGGVYQDLPFGWQIRPSFWLWTLPHNEISAT